MDELLLPVTVEPLEEGGYLATSPVWDELLAQGRTIAETLEIAADVARKLIEPHIEHGDPLPEFLAKGSHEIWYHPQTHRRVVIPHHPGDPAPACLRFWARRLGGPGAHPTC